MRLIDIDNAFSEALRDKRFIIQMEDMMRMEYVYQTVYRDLYDYLEAQPTAYHYDKVVRMLEQKASYYLKEFQDFKSEKDYIRYKTFIEALKIVTGGMQSDEAGEYHE